MAAQQNTTVDIVDIQVNYQDAIRDIATYRENVAQLKQDQEDLKTQLKAGAITQKEYDKAMAATNINLKNQKDAMRALEKQVLNQVREQQRQEGSLQQLRAQLSNATKAYDEMGRAERQSAAGKQMLEHINKITTELKKAEEESQRYYRNVGNYPSAFSKLGDMFKGLTGGATSFSGAIGGIASKLGGLAFGITGIVSAFSSFVSAMKEGVSTAMDFEKQMSTLAAVTGGSTDDIKRLEEQARQLGATTKYTATEVGALQTELAKLGYSQDDILNMTEHVQAFATATGSSLADAASLAGATLRMFGDDTSHTQEYVDKLAASCTNSALDFGFLQTAMSTVGPVANAFNFNIEDVLSLLGQLANAGFDASSAATATRNILLNLADANGDLAQSLGAPVTDLASLTKGLRTLEENGIDLAQSLELTDKRSVAAFNTFLKTADGADKLHDTLVNADGAAKQMASTMADNLEGDVASLGSAWDDFMIEINNGQSILRSVVQWLVEIVRAASGMYKDVRAYFEELYEQSALFRTIVKAIGVNFSNTWKAAGIVLSNFVAQLKAAGKVLKGVLTLDWNLFTEGLSDGLNAAMNNVKQLVKMSADGVIDVVNTAFGAMTTKANAATKKLNFGQNLDKKKKKDDDEDEDEDDRTNGKTKITTKGDKKRQKKAEADAKKAKTAADRAEKEERKREDNELKAIQAYEAELTKLMGSSLDARRAQVKAKYNKEIGDLEKTLNQKQSLTATAEDAIRKTIELKKQEQAIELQKLEEENVRKEIDKRVELLQSELNITQSKTYEHYNILRTIEQEENNKRISAYNSAQAEELQGVEQGSAEELAIIDRYNQLRENSRTAMWQNIHTIDDEQQTALNENRMQILENQLSELEIENSQIIEAKQALEDMGLEIVTEGEMAILEKEREIAEQRLQDIISQGQLETETKEQFYSRQLKAKQNLVNAEGKLKQAELKNETAYLNSMQSITNSLISLTDAVGESNEAFTQISKVLTLAQIAIDTGRAISAGIASASSLGYPQNIIAIASTVATVIANIATAIQTVNSAKFATGAVNIRGAGTSTSDSIPARISNGESVINAKATKMFAPVLEAMNAIGNGAPLPTNYNSYRNVDNAQLMTDAFVQAAREIRPVVSVEEISDVSHQVEVIQSLDNL